MAYKEKPHSWHALRALHGFGSPLSLLPYPSHPLQLRIATASTRLRLCLCALSMSQANYRALLTAILHATCALSIRHVARMSAAMFTQKEKYKMKQNR